MCKWVETKNIKPLSSLCEGETGKIVKIRGKAEDHCYLLGRGIAIGKSVALENTGTRPEDTSIFVRIGNKISEIQKKVALNVRVQVTRIRDEKEIATLEKQYVRVYYDR
jgi:Fe2+ transport system protein FeoA